MSNIVKVESIDGFSPEKLDLIKRTVCKDATDDELKLFLHVCYMTGLDPFLKQIYSIKRGGTRTIQTSIDGLRLVAERTGKYSPGKEPSYAYDANGRLSSASAYVRKMTPDGTWHEVASTCIFSEYYTSIGNFWKNMPHVMLAKCAEANALRKAFPTDMCALYIKEEMDQAMQDQEDSNTISVEPLPDHDYVEYRLVNFLSNFEPNDHGLLKLYLVKYGDHYKKSLVDSIKNQEANPEKFNSDFAKFKARELAKTSVVPDPVKSVFPPSS